MSDESAKLIARVILSAPASGPMIEACRNELPLPSHREGMCAWSAMSSALLSELSGSTSAGCTAREGNAS